MFCQLIAISKCTKVFIYVFVLCSVFSSHCMSPEITSCETFPCGLCSDSVTQAHGRYLSVCLGMFFGLVL